MTARKGPGRWQAGTSPGRPRGNKDGRSEASRGRRGGRGRSVRGRGGRRRSTSRRGRATYRGAWPAGRRRGGEGNAGRLRGRKVDGARGGWRPPFTPFHPPPLNPKRPT